MKKSLNGVILSAAKDLLFSKSETEDASVLSMTYPVFPQPVRPAEDHAHTFKHLS